MRDKLLPTGTPGVFRRERDNRLVAWVGLTSDKTAKKTFRCKVMPKRATVADARRVAEDLRDDAKMPQLRTRPPSLLVYSATWIARKLARGEWTPGSATQANVEHHVTNHIAKVLGDVLLDRLTAQDLQLWLDGQYALKAKASSIRSRWITLRGLVADGCAEYGLPNPADAVKLSRKVPRTHGKDLTLLPVQVRALLEVARLDSPQLWYPLKLLGFCSGARPGELVAVKVSDLDLRADVGKWNIKRHWIGGRIVDGTKQHPEGRPTYLDPQTTAVLRELVARREAADGPDAWLFPAGGRAAGDGGCITTQGLYVAMQRYAEKLKIPALSGKTFRQTHITLSSLAGIQQSLVMAQVGHNSQQVHAIYNRPPEQPRQDAVRRFGEVIHLPDLAPVGTLVGTEFNAMEIN